MVEIFVISDTHFGHANILTFKNYNGTLVRSFSSVEEMDQTMIDNWNRVVQPQDKVYHLGDVAINKKYVELVGRCNGHKRLIMGNHDIFDMAKYYTPHFEKILSMRIFSHKCIMTHVPIHPECIARFKVNIHGHTHGNDVTGDFYFNASVEKINYTPVSLDSILDSMK